MSETKPRPLPEITEVQRLVIQPGDRLIIRYTGGAFIDEAGVAEIRGRVKAALQLPPDFPLVLMDGDWQVLVGALTPKPCGDISLHDAHDFDHDGASYRCPGKVPYRG